MEDEFAATDKRNKYILIGAILAVLILVIGLFTIIGITTVVPELNVPDVLSDDESINVLVIGELSLGERIALDNLSHKLRYSIREVTSFGNDVSEELQQYDIVILDQSQSTDKSVTTILGEAIQKYVDKGGKLIVVMNSGIEQSIGFGDQTVIDAIGWKANFGDVMPAECIPNSKGAPSCKVGASVVGRIYRQDYDHPIMNGIAVAPTVDQVPYALLTFGIQANEGAKTIAYIKSENTPQTYPAIIEKKNFPFGTVIYFNYDPGLTPTIFKQTVEYLE
jgi:hypothetical protein